MWSVGSQSCEQKWELRAELLVELLRSSGEPQFGARKPR